MMQTYLDVPRDSHFSIHNIPFGVCSFPDLGKTTPRVCSAIGDFVIDLVAVTQAALWPQPSIDYGPVFASSTLNAFMALGRTHWRYIRHQLQLLYSENAHREAALKALVPKDKAQMHLPIKVGDYTDFYSSKEHAVNVGTMFRGKENALNPNWVHAPIGYHGRASSIVLSGTDIKRPWGQVKPADSDSPVLSPSKKLDFELEMAFVVGVGNALGQPIPVDEAEAHIFGLVLMNDWSARDIQAWEYVPLGPFLGKNFATTISPWVVTLDALEAFRCDGPEQCPAPLEYLKEKQSSHFQVNLEVLLTPAGSDKEHSICTTDLRYLYWSFAQQLAHHTVTGCNMQTGDLCGTGTISGPSKESMGSLLEISWNGKEPIAFPHSGTSRTFLEDGDRVRFVGRAGDHEHGIGFGECIGTITPASPPARL